MNVVVSKAGSVRAQVDIDLPMPAATVWGQMRDFSQFATLDTMHRRIIIEGGKPRPGAGIVIEHRFLGLGVDRVGRILSWREGYGYCFSDLSKRGRRSGFPHVCGYQLAATGAHTSRLTLFARGRWTAQWLPRWIVKTWIKWILAHSVGIIRFEMMRIARRRQRLTTNAARNQAGSD